MNGMVVDAGIESSVLIKTILKSQICRSQNLVIGQLCKNTPVSKYCKNNFAPTIGVIASVTLDTVA